MKAITANFSLGKEVLNRFTSRFSSRREDGGALSIHLADIPEPDLVSSHWVKIRSIMSAISDIDEGMLTRRSPAGFGAFLSFPFVPGNENLGIITDTGPDVHGLAAGERVVVDPVLACEARGIDNLCPSCRRREPSACRNFAEGILSPGATIGSCRDTGGGWGDSFIAHKSQVRLVPPGVDSNQALLAPEFARAVRGVLSRPPRPGERILIMGARSLGLLTLSALRLLGYDEDVIIVAEHPFEADVARRLDSAEVVTAHGPGSTYEDLAGMLDGAVRYPEVGRITMSGGADLVYETTGLKTFMEDALRFAGEGKRLVCLGINEPVGFNITPIWFKNVSIYGSSFSCGETLDEEMTTSFDIALDLIARHGLPYDDIVTHAFGLDEYRDAFSVLGDRLGNKAIKVVFQHVV